MKRILLIKMSSMGDIIHMLPAVTDAMQHGFTFDWLVDDSFSEIPEWHPAVTNIIPVALRRWKKSLFSGDTYKEVFSCYKQLRANKYSSVVDCQGLFKSAIFGFLANSKICAGLTKDAAREPLASLLYNKKIYIHKDTHIVAKLRTLLANSLDYEIPDALPDFGISSEISVNVQDKPYLVFFHGTTWKSKHWPDEHWADLIRLAQQSGYIVKMTWAGAEQKQRVIDLRKLVPELVMLPHLTITQAKDIINYSSGVVSVDTGFGHLATALKKPTLMLFGASDPNLVGPCGDKQKILQAKMSCIPCKKRTCSLNKTGTPDCLSMLNPKNVWNDMQLLLSSPLELSATT